MIYKASKTETLYAIIDSQKLAYRRFGEGSPIILTNRFRGTLDTWDPLFLDLLAETNTVITFDYSGIGYSEGILPTDIKEVAAQSVKLADFLKIDKFIAGGWSYGGIVAQYTTFMFPERILSSILIGTNPIGKNAVPLSALFLEKSLLPTNDLEKVTQLFYEPKSEKSRLAAKASEDRIAQRIDHSKVPANPELLKRYFAATEQIAVDTDNFREAYKTLKTPVLVISGDNDISFAVENWFPLLQNAPTIQHIIFSDSGHAMQHQFPQESTDYIKSFFKNN